eukprot:6194648-Pleurochrysis_carterae.AAC.4
MQALKQHIVRISECRPPSVESCVMDATPATRLQDRTNKENYLVCVIDTTQKSNQEHKRILLRSPRAVPAERAHCTYTAPARTSTPRPQPCPSGPIPTSQRPPTGRRAVSSTRNAR